MPWFELLKKWTTLDRMVALGLIIICAFFYWEASNYPAGGSYFPHFSLVAIILLSTLMLIFSFRPKQKQRPAESENAEKDKRNLRPFILTGIFFLYLFIAPRMGLFTSTAVLICAVMAFLKIRQVKLYVLVVLVVTVSFYIFFGLILKVSIPGSILI
jgi:hypothetical protein